MKESLLQKAKNNIHPLRELNMQDVERAVSKLGTPNSHDEWAQVWMDLAADYVTKGQANIDSGDKEAAIALWQMSLRYYYLARWPIPNSSQKLAAYQQLKQTYQLLGTLLPQPIECLSIPYHGQMIRAYLRHPGKSKVPLIIHWGGIDTWKEDLLTISNAYLAKGWASLMIDMPGTGECPEIASPSAEKVFKAVLDYVKTRAELDATNIAVQGSSWGGYWASKLALVEPQRIKAAVNWGGPIHHFFTPTWQKSALASTEYLFDTQAAVCALYQTTDFAEYLQLNQAMSLQEQQLLGNQSAPLLYVNGEQDTLVPFADAQLLSSQQNVTIWTNPKGIHMGVCHDIKHPYIMGNIILPWLSNQFSESAK